MSRPKDSDPSLPGSAAGYPVPCPKCGADADFTGLSTVVGKPNLLHLKIVCEGCQYSWVVEKSTLPLSIRGRRQP